MSQANGVILVVDDSAESLGMLNTTLVMENYTVLVAMDGVQAISIAEKIQPDLVLMDAIMPNMDGFETCKAFKANTDLMDIPIVFMTGLSETEHVVKAFEAGGVDYVNKPIKLEELLARIKVHLNNSRLTRSARSALDGLSQAALACDRHGTLMWCTHSARVLLDVWHSEESVKAKADPDLRKIDSLPDGLRLPIKQWLDNEPEKHSFLTVKSYQNPISIRFLGIGLPGEYLLRLVEEDELSLRNRIRDRFELTDREAEVLMWLSRGKTNRDIGQILSMSPRTVNKHLEQVFKKLGVENRTSAAAVSLQFQSTL